MLPLRKSYEKGNPRNYAQEKNDLLNSSRSCRKLIYCVIVAPYCLLSIVANDMRFICDIPQTTLYVNIKYVQF